MNTETETKATTTTTTEPTKKIVNALRRVTQTIDCATELTHSELLERFRELAALKDQAAEADEDLQYAKDKHKEITKKLDLRRDELEAIGKSGKEDRPITCVRRPDYVRGVWEWVREDNGQVAKTERMTRQDQQLTVPGAEVAPAKKAPVILTEAIDSDGEIHHINAEQADQVRIALNQAGLKYVDIEIGGKLRRIESLKACADCGAADGKHRKDGHPELDPAWKDPELEDEPSAGDTHTTSVRLFALTEDGDEVDLTEEQAQQLAEWVAGSGPQRDNESFSLTIDGQEYKLEELCSDDDDETSAAMIAAVEDLPSDDDQADSVPPAKPSDEPLVPKGEASKPPKKGRKGS